MYLVLPTTLYPHKKCFKSGIQAIFTLKIQPTRFPTDLTRFILSAFLLLVPFNQRGAMFVAYKHAPNAPMLFRLGHTEKSKNK